jgi:UDPglucose 6-dehydrogenase
LPEVANYWQSVIDINDYQKNRFVENVIHTMYDSIKNRHLTIFGFSFKKDTSDTRESPAITVCHNLMEEGAMLHIYDPKVSVERINDDLHGFSDHYVIENDPYQACVHSEGLLILSAWDMFKMLDYSKIYASMDHPSYIFDGYNLLDRQSLQRDGFIVYAIGINDKI